MNWVTHPSATGAQALEQGLLAGLEVAAVEKPELDAVVEEDPIATPGEAVGEDDGALGALGDARQVDLGAGPLAEGELDERLGFAGQLVGVPNGHGQGWYVVHPVGRRPGVP